MEIFMQVFFFFFVSNISKISNLSFPRFNYMLLINQKNGMKSPLHITRSAVISFHAVIPCSSRFSDRTAGKGI